MTRLFWKVYLPLALCVVMTLALSVFAMVKIVPAQISSYRESMEEFTGFLRSSQSLDREQIIEMAESLDLVVHVELQGAHPGGMPPPPPDGFARLPGLPPNYPWMIDVSVSPQGGPGGFLRRSLWLILLLLLVTEGFVLYFALWPVRKRLARLSWAASEFGSGNLGVRLHSQKGGDFIDSLGRTFNGMAGEIEVLVASHQELLGIVAHELRTPLARMRFALELIREDSGGGSLPKLDRMEKDLVALDQLVTELLAFNRLSRQEDIKGEDVDLGSVCGEVADAETWNRGDISMTVSGEGICRGDRTLLGRAMGNLVRNAVIHASSRVAVSVTSLPGGETRISVEDDGPGFDAAIRDRLGDPFVKGPSSTGSGLGLAMARRIAVLHGGRLEFGSSGELGGGRVDLIF